MALTLVAGVKSRYGLDANREDIKYFLGMNKIPLIKSPSPLPWIGGLATFDSDTVEFHKYHKKGVPFTTKVNYGSGYATSDVAIVVDDVTIFVPGDIVRVEETGENLLVITVTDGSNTLGIIRDYGQGEGWTTALARIEDDYNLVRIGSAYQQGHGMPEIVTTKEIDVKNYCQTFRSVRGATEEVLGSALRGMNEWEAQEWETAMRHNIDRDHAWFWNKPYVGDKKSFDGTHDSGDAPTTTGGLNNCLETNNNSDLLEDNDDMTMYEYMDSLEKAFATGSNERLQLCPAKFRTGLDKWGITKLQTFVPGTIMGQAVEKWRSSHGLVIFSNHDLLTPRLSTNYYTNFLLDMTQLALVYHNDHDGNKSIPGMTHWRTKQNYDTNGGYTWVKEELWSKFGFMFGDPDCHMRLRFKTISM